MSQKISVIYCFPRSGGTLLNQCLLCEPTNVVLSEVNPAGSVLPAEKQAAEWFHLLASREMADCAELPYLEKISLIHHRAQAAGRNLCLRDWTGVNFLANISPWLGIPSQRLEQHVYLARAGFELHEVALLRRSQAVYHSILQNIPELKELTPKDFAATYRTYLEQLTKIKKYHLENLIRDKQTVLHNLCTDLLLSYASDFEARFHTISTVTGNNTLPKLPVSAGWTSIHNDAPHASDRVIAKRSRANLFEELDKLAGYQPS